MGFIRRDVKSFAFKDVFSYRYFTEGAIEKNLLEFMLDESKEGPLAKATEIMLFKLIPLFASENERLEFERWCGEHWSLINEEINAHDYKRYIPTEIPENVAMDIRRKARISEVLVEKLESFRYERDHL